MLKDDLPLTLLRGVAEQGVALRAWLPGVGSLRFEGTETPSLRCGMKGADFEEPSLGELSPEMELRSVAILAAMPNRSIEGEAMLNAAPFSEAGVAPGADTISGDRALSRASFSLRALSNLHLNSI